MSDDNKINLQLVATDNLSPTMLKAIDSIQKISDSVSNLTPNLQANTEAHSQLNGSMVNLAAGAELLSTGVEFAKQAWDMLEQSLEKAIDESEAAEQANNLLVGAMISNGTYTTQAAASVEAYVKAVHDETGANEEVTKTHIALAMQMGLSAEKAEEMEEASRKLAVLTGGDSNQAFSILQQTLSGHSRALTKLLPQIKDLNAGQLAMGDAAGVVNQVLQAQYEQYQGSYAAGVERAKNSVSEIYKEIGNLITQNPVVLEGLRSFATVAGEVAEAVKDAGTWIKENSSEIEAFANSLGKAAVIVGAVVAGMAIFNVVGPFAVAVWGALTTSVSLYGVAGTIAANATALLDGALAILAAPVTLTIAAVVALTAAFMKWPGLFDILIGSIKTLIGVAIAPMVAAFGGLAIGVGKIVEVFNKDLGTAISNAGESMLKFTANTVQSGIEQVKYGATHMSAAKDVVSGTDAVTAATEASRIATSKDNAEKANAIKLYGELSIGTTIQRTQLDNQKKAQDGALADFTKYYDNRIQVAKAGAQREALEEANVAQYRATLLKSAGNDDPDAQGQATRAMEAVKRNQIKAALASRLIDNAQYNQTILAQNRQAAELDYQEKLTAQTQIADLLKGSGGSNEANAAAQQSIAAENLKQQQLATAYAKEKITKDQFDAAMLASSQKNATSELTIAQSKETAIINLMGLDQTAFQKKQKLVDTQYKLEMQQNLAQAKQAGASQQQLETIQEQGEQAHNAAMNVSRQQDLQAEVTRQEQLQNDWGVTLANIELQQAKHGQIMGALEAVASSSQYKAANDGLTNLASLRNSHSKAAFEVGQKAAIAQATVQTFMSATEAFASLAAVPIVGPILGAAAAAAAVAAGFVNIQNIASQKFSPQAHGGLDAVPAGMDNTTFLLKAGERVVQPEANKDLTAFLAKQPNASDGKGTGTGSGNTNNITLNYSGNMTQDDVKTMADMLVKEIRKRSERGVPIMNAKGLVNNSST